MWEQIRSNKIKSAVLTIVMLVILALLGFVIGYAVDLWTAPDPIEGEPETTGGLSGGVVGIIISVVLWVIMALVAYFSGDQVVLSMSNAKKIKKEDHPRLWNIVEEMTIASGVAKMPDVYIINDPSPNAFAAGRDEQHACIAVTTGLLSLLNRDELQGVVAHEMAHIKNRDVLYMSMVSVMLGAIVLISWYGTRLLFFGGSGNSNSNSGPAQLIILLVGVVLMILAPIAAQLIYFAVSRKREYLADATGALYTRYPEGLASALEKIGSSNVQVKAANQATAAMYIANPFRKEGKKVNLEELSSTHPPIAERVRILRQMGHTGMVSYENYEHFFESDGKKQTGESGHIVPGSAMGLAAVAVREPSIEDEAVGLGQLQRTREAKDAGMKSSGYVFKECNCGATLKAPASYKGQTVSCPYCGDSVKFDE